MAFTRRLPKTVSALDIRTCPIPEGESIWLHRYITEDSPRHDTEDPPSCWCSPTRWPHYLCKNMSLREIEQRIDAHLTVH